MSLHGALESENWQDGYGRFWSCEASNRRLPLERGAELHLEDHRPPARARAHASRIKLGLLADA